MRVYIYMTFSCVVKHKLILEYLVLSSVVVHNVLEASGGAPSVLELFLTVAAHDQCQLVFLQDFLINS